ncbi:MAG: acyl-CoA thioesterase, partial [candidate division Zixibacteria bacterium]|nr:acyl-CoA thioesterase [candidate division Zixibacteria bacterium]
TDAAGVVFFANYFRIAHTAFEAFMKSIGCGVDYMIRSADFLILIVHAEADYKRPFLLGDTVSISVEAAGTGATSFVLTYLMRDSAGHVRVTVRTAHVAIDKKTGEKILLPEKVRNGIQSIS